MTLNVSLHFFLKTSHLSLINFNSQSPLFPPGWLPIFSPSIHPRLSSCSLIYAWQFGLRFATYFSNDATGHFKHPEISYICLLWLEAFDMMPSWRSLINTYRLTPAHPKSYAMAKYVRLKPRRDWRPPLQKWCIRSMKILFCSPFGFDVLS